MSDDSKPAEIRHIGCRLCVIQENATEVLADNDNDQGKAMMMCYVAGFAEHMTMSSEMQKSMCIKHGVLVARYALRCVQMLTEMLERGGEEGDVIKLPPIPSGKDVN